MGQMLAGGGGGGGGMMPVGHAGAAGGGGGAAMAEGGRNKWKADEDALLIRSGARLAARADTRTCARAPR